MNSSGTIDLPLKFIVSLAIGLFALFIVVSYIRTLKPSPSLIVSWDKDIYEFDGKEILIEVTVVDENSKPISGANVIIKGLGNFSSQKTIDGKAVIAFMPHLEENEGYLSIEVRAIGYEKYEGIEKIKVVRK
ncbi:MAG: carboxypeptidase regulatory-like domain-containing protein [Thermoplasmatales archaeon]|nr:carboxypeptidase regulatory-like domain-containing protein [Thermoplasmatales archaeon]